MSSISRFVRFALASSTLAAAVSLAPSAGAANDVFLSIAGIPGEATDEGFTGQIAVNSFTLGTSLPENARLASAGAVPKPQFDMLTISKPLDKASVKLFEAAVTGKRLPSVVLSTRRPGEKKQAYYKVTLSDVVITSVKVSETQGVSESVAFSFAKVEMEYWAQDAKGGYASVGKFVYDVNARK